jgi:glycosyltransferase involved in cell wall biosynthesis
MNFSYCLIVRNEENTLPRLLKSLEGFKERGGKVLVCDTGSTDKTAEIARNWGCEVYEQGEYFKREISKELAHKINLHFLVDNEEPVVKAGDSLFDFSAARNWIAEKSPTAMVAMPDADEIYTQLDLDTIEKHIEEGVEQFEYNFVFSHDAYGNEAIKFMHSKFYNRDKMKWVGVIHEVLSGSAKKQFLPESVIKLEHWQNHGTNRSGYLTGLALDCFLNPENDRNSHYFAREMLWAGRYKSAIKEFERHIAMNKWPAEAGQSMIFIGDAYMKLGQQDKAVESYHKALQIDFTRREAVMKLCDFFLYKQDWLKVAGYAAMSLEIPPSNFYANWQEHNTYKPHEYMYLAQWWLGDKERAKYHFDKCLAFSPTNTKFLHDYRFFYTLPSVTFILPTLGRPDGLERCLKSIENLNYPKELVDVIVKDGEGTVPNKVAEAYKESKGDWLVFASNDTEFTPDSLIIAYMAASKENKALVAFNTGEVIPDRGNICQHFMVNRHFVENSLHGEIFDTEFYHVGVDNLLWAKAEKANQAMRCDGAKVEHYHFSTGRSKMDEVYEKGWQPDRVQHDRLLLKKKLEELESKPILT